MAVVAEVEIFLELRINFFKNLLTNQKIRRIMCNNKFTKEDTDMFAGKFYYFYFFNMGCPSFVKTEK